MVEISTQDYRKEVTSAPLNCIPLALIAGGGKHSIDILTSAALKNSPGTLKKIDELMAPTHHAESGSQRVGPLAMLYLCGCGYVCVQMLLLAVGCSQNLLIFRLCTSPSAF